MESSRRDLLNDRAEPRSILKNNQNTYYPHYSFTPTTGIAFPETGVLFSLCSHSDFTFVQSSAIIAFISDRFQVFSFYNNFFYYFSKNVQCLDEIMSS